MTVRDLAVLLLCEHRDNPDVEAPFASADAERRLAELEAGECKGLAAALRRAIDGALHGRGAGAPGRPLPPRT